MPADTFSSILGFLEMGTGNDNNIWGSNANASVFSIFENAIGGMLTIGMSGGTTDLSGTPPPAGPSAAAYKIINCTGTGGGILQVPNLTMDWVLYNNTSADFFMQTPSGSQILIPVGTQKRVWCDGSNVLYRHDREEIGKLILFANASVPAGSLECDGSSLLRASYPDLFGKIGTTWGSADGIHFTLPKLNDTGRFPRSRKSGTDDAGTTYSNQNASHTHSATGISIGISDPTHNHGVSDPTHNHGVSDPGHTHSFTYNGIATGGGGGAVNSIQTSGGTFAVTTQGNTTGVSINGNATGISINGNATGITASASGSTAASGGTEARPEAAVVRMCIKY